MENWMIINKIKNDILDSIETIPDSSLLALILPSDISSYISDDGKKIAYFNIDLITRSENPIELNSIPNTLMNYMVANTARCSISYNAEYIWGKNNAIAFTNSGIVFSEVLNELVDDELFQKKLFKNADYHAFRAGVIIGDTNLTLERFYYLNFATLTNIEIECVNKDNQDIFRRIFNENMMELTFSTSDGFIFQILNIFKNTARSTLAELLEILNENEKYNQFALQIELELMK